MPSSSIAMSETVKATAWRLEIGSPKAGAFVDVGDHVVEHRLRGADRERAPGDPRALHALGVGLGPALAQQGARRDPGRPPAPAGRWRRRARPSPVRGSTARPSVFDSMTKRPGPWPSTSAATTKSSPSPGARQQRLGAVEHQVLALLACPGLQRERVEQRLGLLQRQRRRGHVLAGERRQVGGLLVGVAPVADRGGDGAGGEGGVGDAHVAVGERLADQHGCRRPSARCITPPSSSGTPSMLMPSSLACASSSSGVCSAVSASFAAGRSFSSANSRTPPGASAARRRAEVEEARRLAGALAGRACPASGRCA